MKKLLLLIAFAVSVFSGLIAQGSLKAEYYNGTNFDTYVGTEFVSKIDFYWYDRPPIKGLEPDNCSVLYTGQLKAPRSGIVTFSARVDDGIQVWINDQKILSNWQLNDVGYAKGEMHMEANKAYNIKIKYFNAMNEAELKLFWKLPSDPNWGWFKRLWHGEDPVKISSKYFSLPATPKA